MKGRAAPGRRSATDNEMHWSGRSAHRRKEPMNRETDPLDPDLLVAFVDGELSAEQAAEVEGRLARDESAREMVRLLRLSADAAAKAYAGVVDEPVPAGLLAAARGQRLGTPTHKASSQRTRWPRLWSMALAASLAAFFIGLAGGYELGSPGTPVGGYVPAAVPTSDPLKDAYEAALQAALDGGQVGQIYPYESKGSGEGRIKLGAEFTTGAGIRCREFDRQETRGGAASADSGIACLGADGSWSVMLLGKTL